MRPIALLLLVTFASSLRAEESPPRSLDARLKITLFAENPQLVTPTGIDVDERGRVWAIESNTHFPPKDYKGHPTDRLLVLGDSDGDGRADKETLFVDGLKHTMSVAVRPSWLPPVVVDKEAKPAVQQVFVATRREILLLEDLDGDDRSDRQTKLVWLETKGDYPHNGLAGFAFDPVGNLFFGFGENLGEPYAIHSRGAPDKPLKGGDEGGNIYRMRPDGTEMAFWATGFWNPHASCIDAFGRLFTVDNDPDSRPPCRLLHVIRGGDYGYRFRNGRKGLHPFTAWNGELPGTLPMVAGTGEAPSGILAYEHDAFPAEYLGNLIVTSWGDHRLDRFRLKPKGASVESVAEPFVVGGESFRPVGIALAPDGSLYCTDWVKRDYQLHGHGRVWRIHPASAVSTPAAGDDPRSRLASPRVAVRRAAARELANASGKTPLPDVLVDRTAAVRSRLEALWGMAQSAVDPQRPPLMTQADILKEVLAHVEDPVFLEMIALADLPQIGYPDVEHWQHKAGQKGSPAPVDSDLFLSSVVRSTPAALRIKTAGVNFAGLAYNSGMASTDPFVSAATVDEMLRSDWKLDAGRLADKNRKPNEVANWAVYARRHQPRDTASPRLCLTHPSTLVRQVAVQWAGEERLTELRPEVEGVLSSDAVTVELFLATLAALEMLDGRSPQDFDKTPPGKYVVPLLKDPKRSISVRTQALKLLPPTAPEISSTDLAAWAASENEAFATEAVRSLAGRDDVNAEQGLLAITSAPSATKAIRLDAILGLATRAASSEKVQKALVERLSSSKDDDERIELLRSLRAAGGVSTVSAAVDSWLKGAADLPPAIEEQARRTLASRKEGAATDLRTAATWLKTAGAGELPKGNLERGRRLFFHPEGPGCFKCHVVDGRGGPVGPNLSRIGASMTREKLIESILEPSKEVSPQFTSWTLISSSGQVLTGMIVHENEGTTVLGDSAGKTTTVKTADVEERVPQKVSVMPEKLAERMTPDEFFDLVSFLESLR